MPKLTDEQLVLKIDELNEELAYLKAGLDPIEEKKKAKEIASGK